jgi:hypothetical protein
MQLEESVPRVIAREISVPNARGKHDIDRIAENHLSRR